MKYTHKSMFELFTVNIFSPISYLNMQLNLNRHFQFILMIFYINMH